MKFCVLNEKLRQSKASYGVWLKGTLALLRSVGSPAPVLLSCVKNCTIFDNSGSLTKNEEGSRTKKMMKTRKDRNEVDLLKILREGERWRLDSDRTTKWSVLCLRVASDHDWGSFEEAFEGQFRSSGWQDKRIGKGMTKEELREGGRWANCATGGERFAIEADIEEHFQLPERIDDDENEEENGQMEVETLLPMLVLIHGGAFSIGSARQFADHRDIGAKFVSHGIVVVAIQYRLGVFGFAFSVDAQMPGNFGLWDQLAALQFIRLFGGNPEDITLLGHSAGAASVSALAISPHSRHLFQRAIQMVGSVFSSFLLGAHVHRLTLGLVETLDCEEPPKECLKRKSVDEIHAAVERMGPAKVRLGPRIDRDFFSHDIPSLVDTSPKKPTLIDFTDPEALQFTLLHGKNSTIMAMAVPWSETDNYGPECGVHNPVVIAAVIIYMCFSVDIIPAHVSYHFHIAK
ncbi:hypothetical protein niasHT_013825 [Heterodera trifolii]|uniref:Carboxylic ester hydrolase n=1 Tax=Heterodera trifolii TaxID=157864 RepID=A0ABD2KTK4_9BILA